MKHVSRRHLRADMAVNFTKPVSGTYMHFKTYYKYSIYRPIAIDMWEEVCGWFDGTGKSYFLDLTLKLLYSFAGVETNVNHPCPYVGYHYLRFKNISVDQMSKFDYFMPSGRYRIDGELFESDKKTIIASLKFYLSVSDNRIEQY